MAASGYRSPLFYWGGGAAKPLSTGQYGAPISLLAFWIGGACLHFVPIPVIPPSPPLSDMTGGLPYGRRRRIDDDEIEEFIRIWTIWNDNE